MKIYRHIEFDSSIYKKSPLMDSHNLKAPTNLKETLQYMGKAYKDNSKFNILTQLKRPDYGAEKVGLGPVNEPKSNWGPQNNQNNGWGNKPGNGSGSGLNINRISIRG